MKYYAPSSILLAIFWVLLCEFIFLIMVASSSIGMKISKNVTVTALFGFGDSIIDPGNNNNVETLIKCNFPPYGQDFMGGIPTGRFSNGKIPTDLIAEMLSIKQYVPAYSDPNLQPKDLLTGVSFASGGAGFDPLTSKLASAISLPQQLDHFKEYITRVKRLVGEERTNFIVANALFLVVAGSDDIANTYFDTPLVRRKHYSVDSYTNLMLNHASSFIEGLYKLGARRMAVFSAAVIGCVPSQRTIGGGILRDCAEDYNKASQIYNSKLYPTLISLQRNLPHSKIAYIDIYNAMLDMVLHPQKYGFEESAKGCCGTGVIEVSILCNPFVKSVCADDSKYLFWDSYHPTESGYHELVNLLISVIYTVL